MIIKTLFFRFYIGSLVLGPIFLLLLPADFFDHGQPWCLSVVFFDQICYGCGMTRAIQHLIHLDYVKASGFNKLSFIVLPLLIFLWISEIKQTYKKLKD